MTERAVVVCRRGRLNDPSGATPDGCSVVDLWNTTAETVAQAIVDTFFSLFSHFISHFT